MKAQNPNMEIWAVEPENAAILAGGTVGTHLQMGIGDGVIPEILNQQIYDDIYIVTDEEAIQTAKDLARLEGLMCGISSGTNVAAARKLAKKLGKSAKRWSPFCQIPQSGISVHRYLNRNKMQTGRLGKPTVCNKDRIACQKLKQHTFLRGGPPHRLSVLFFCSFYLQLCSKSGILSTNE